MRARKISGMAWRQRWPDHVDELCSRVTLKAWSISTRWCPCWRDSKTSVPNVIGPATASCSTTSTSASCYSTSLVPRLPACALCSRLRPWRPFNDDWGFGRRRWAPLAKPRGCLTPRPCTKSSRNWRPRPLVNGPDARQLLDLTAVDGSIFRAFPRMAWALWKDSEHRGVKLHLHFDVFCGTPLDASITHASGSETDQLRAMLRPGRLYVIDRGYLDHELYRQIIEADSSFIGRIKDNGSYTTESQCPLTAADRAAGIASDERLKRLGTPHHKNELRGHQLRLVKVQRTNDEGELETWWLLTNKLDLPAELVALGYRYRWTVELFFRWLKCVLGCKQLLTTSENGVALQIYTALIASLLIVLWTGRKPTKRTWEMLQFYFQGWASLEEVQAHLEKQKLIALKSQETDGPPKKT